MDSLILSDLTLDFENERNAEIIYNTVIVDKELSGKVTRNVQLKGAVIHAQFNAANVRDLRGSVKGFLDGVILATKTIQQFGSD
jgi:tRNA threonylcarbamoyladenosine modification (KEOPS) complex  Pcc1 subunit